MSIKLIANYLPQYHVIPQNDKWWGKGFTDWEMARNSVSLFEKHNQLIIPLKENYYKLSHFKYD